MTWLTSGNWSQSSMSTKMICATRTKCKLIDSAPPHFRTLLLFSAYDSNKFIFNLLSHCNEQMICYVADYVPFCTAELCNQQAQCIQDPTNIDSLCVSPTRLPHVSTTQFYGACPAGFSSAPGNVCKGQEIQSMRTNNSYETKWYFSGNYTSLWFVNYFYYKKPDFILSAVGSCSNSL